MTKTNQQSIERRVRSSLVKFTANHPYIVVFTNITVILFSQLITFLVFKQTWLSGTDDQFVRIFWILLLLDLAVTVTVVFLLVKAIRARSTTNSRFVDLVIKSSSAKPALILLAVFCVIAATWWWLPSYASNRYYSALNKAQNQTIEQRNHEYSDAIKSGCLSPNDVYTSSGEFDLYRRKIARLGTDTDKEFASGVAKNVYDASKDCINGTIDPARNQQIYDDALRQVKARALQLQSQ